LIAVILDERATHDVVNDDNKKERSKGVPLKNPRGGGKGVGGNVVVRSVGE
jgi:hypothetical protein